MNVINDPLGQTDSHASGDHYSRLNFVLFCEILKSTDGQRACVKTMITTSCVDQYSSSWAGTNHFPAIKKINWKKQVLFSRYVIVAA